MNIFTEQPLLIEIDLSMNTGKLQTDISRKNVTEKNPHRPHTNTLTEQLLISVHLLLSSINTICPYSDWEYFDKVFCRQKYFLSNCQCFKKGICRKTGVGYRITCNECGNEEVAKYEGETGKNMFIRGCEHADDVAKNAVDKPLWKRNLDIA